jgi:zinc finger protein
MNEDITESLLKEAKREPKLIFQEKTKCPMCGSYSLVIREYIYDVPYFNEIVISEGHCESCGYKYRDVRVLNVSEPKKIVIKVKGEKELGYLLIKSATSAILIKERGFEMIPGPASTGFITTVEGILLRFLDATETACKGRETEPVCKENLEWLRRAIDGKEQFTLIICDYDGTSIVKGENVIEKPIDEECNILKEKSLQLFYK